MRPPFIIVFALALTVAAATPAGAQLGLPGPLLPDTGAILRPLERTLDDIEQTVQHSARELLRARERTLADFLRRNREVVQADARGFPARRGELLVMDLPPEAIETLRIAGLAIITTEQVEGLGFTVTRIGLPPAMELAEGERLLERLAPQATIAADNIHFRSGPVTAAIAARGGTPVATSAQAFSTPVGIIDGAPSDRIGRFTVRGFATGAPAPSDHGSAVAYLLSRAGATNVRVADIYGDDRAGGNALALSRALGWLVQSGSRVVTISLVGPRNAVVERAIRSARERGTIIVAAVGNDGPAAPPPYPASYPGVVAITGVDARNRALIEAGKALHLDYSAPGADLNARNSAGRRVRLRGTSFATPLAAARIAAALGRKGDWRTLVDAEAVDLGKSGPDSTYGRGLLCGSCRDL